MFVFANQAARFAYSVPPSEVNSEFKQTDNNSVYKAVRQGAGAQVWEFAYTVGAASSSLADGDYGDVAVSGTGTVLTVESVAGAFALKGVETQSAFAVQQNNLTVFTGATRVRVSSSADVDISGIAGGADGRQLIFHNTGSFNISFLHASGASTITNRLLCPESITQVLKPNCTATLFYDSSSSRWRVSMGASNETLQTAYDRGDAISMDAAGLHFSGPGGESVFVLDTSTRDLQIGTYFGDDGASAVDNVSNATAGTDGYAMSVTTGTGGSGGAGAANGNGGTKHGADGGDSNDIVISTGNAGPGGQGGDATGGGGGELVSGNGGVGGDSGNITIDVGDPGTGGSAGAASGGAGAGSAGASGVAGEIVVGAENARLVEIGNAQITTQIHGRLEMDAGSNAFLLPRLTTAERDALTSIVNGLILLNTSTNKVQARVSGAWVDLH